MFDLKNGETFNSDANVPLLQNAAGDNEVNAELVSPIPTMKPTAYPSGVMKLKESIFSTATPNCQRRKYIVPR